MLRRLVNLPKSHSFFLFGARGTGKSSLLNSTFSADEALFIDLLKPEEFSILNREPQNLTSRIESIKGQGKWVFIDEIQKIPKLLDLVHHHIEHNKIKFALTGSSARKLKRGSANLLAGRALVYNLFPFTFIELQKQFSLEHALNWGTLPAVINENDSIIKKKILQSYAHTYLKEEVQAEQLIRSLDPFHLFLGVAAQMNGKIINYSKISRECGASDYSVKEYFKILEDTLLGFHLQPYHTSIRKRQLQGPKFYIFDQGVKRSLSGSLSIPIFPRTSAYGEAFEEWLITEIRHLCTYKENDYALSYLRTKDNVEIDLIIERPGLPTALLEIKSTQTVTAEDASRLETIAKNFSKSAAYCLSLDPIAKRFGKVEALHWVEGIKELGIW